MSIIDPKRADRYRPVKVAAAEAILTHPEEYPVCLLEWARAYLKFYPNEAIGQCVEEQRKCAEYLQGGGPDKRGAQQGLSDWTFEETILRREGKGKC